MRHLKLFAVMALAFLLCGCDRLTTAVGVAEQGNIDLTKHDFAKQPVVQLHGEWLLYWEDFIDPLQTNMPPSGTIAQAHATWENKPLQEGGVTAGQGYGTFVLTIEVPDGATQYGIKIQDIGGAYELYANGQKVHQAGTVSSNPAISQSGFHQAVVEFPVSTNNQYQLLIHASSFDYRTGGLWTPIIFGPVTEVRAYHNRLLALGAVVAGGIGLMALYHLVLFLMLPKEKVFGFFSLLGFVLMVRMLSVDERYLFSFFPSMSLSWMYTIEYVSFIMTIPAGVGFFASVMPKAFSSGWKKALSIPGLLFAVYVLVTPPIQFTQYIAFLQIYLLFGVFAGACLMLRSIYRKESDGVSFFIGLAIIVVTVTLDVLATNGYIKTSVVYTSVAIMGLLTAQSISLSRYFVAALRKVETLSGELQQANVSLEQRVSTRTKELERANRQLALIANQDKLTLLGNRRYFDDRFDQLWQAHFENKAMLSLLFCDIDYFKKYNDTLGHVEGDEALKMVASAISTNFNDDEIVVARIGGEEFALLMPNTDIRAAQESGEKLRRVIAELNISHPQSAKNIVTVSVGCAAVIPQANMPKSVLMHMADTALYVAKSKGRNRVELSGEESSGVDALGIGKNT